MNKFGVGLAIGMVVGMSAMINVKKTKQLVKKAKSILNM